MQPISEKNINTIQLQVLHVDTELGWRGGQQQLAYLADAMRKRGDRIGVVCRPKSDMARFCEENRITFFPIRMRGEWDLWAGFQIARTCHHEEFRLLHLHSGHAVTLGLWAKLFDSNLKMIATRRVDFRLHNGFFSRFKYINPWLDKIACVSQEIERIMRKDGVEADRLTVIHSGVDILKYADHMPPADFKNRMGIPADAFVVGTVAAMVGHKDYPTLLKAAKMVLEHDHNIIFCAVGDGPLEKKIKAMAQELKLGRRFIFAGYRRNVGDFLKSFDLFVLSSNQEGLGTSVLDAQAAGVPVAACAAGGIPEMIEDNVTGRLTPKESPLLLAQAILELAADTPRRLNLAAEAKKRVADFSIEKTVEKYIELYQSVLA